MTGSRKIEVVLVGDERALTASLGRASAQINSFAGRMNRAGKSITSAGHSLTRNLTLPLVAAGGAAIKTAADFDSSLSKIQGLVGANTKEMAAYRKSILALAPAVAQGPKALADALYFVTSSGFRGAQALKILAASAKASTAGLGDTQQIADLVTSAMTAYGSKTLSAARATDILVAATKAGKGDPQQFAQALQLNVAAANTLGISFDQLAAATAALSTVNSNVSEDATQLSGIMQALIKPSAGAREELHKLGLSAAALRTEVRDKGLLNTLLDLQKRTNGNVDAIGKLFPNVRGLRGFLTLVGTAAQRNVSIFDQVANSTGDMNKAFKVALTQDPKAQFAKLTAQLQVLAIVIGNQLIPVALEVTAWVVDIANKFNGLSGSDQTFILIAAGVLALVGPLVSVIGSLVLMTGYLAVLARVSGLAAAAQYALSAGLWLVNAALDANPVVLIGLATLALAAAFIIAYKRSETFRAVVQGALHAVATAVDFVRAHWEALVAAIPVIGPVILLIAKNFSLVKRIGVAAFHAVGGAISGMVSLAQSVAGVIQSIVSAMMTLVHAAESAKNFLIGSGGTSDIRHGLGGGHGGRGFRAMGGPVLAGHSYIVGERRPELFTPSQSGYITPRVPSGGQTINMYFYGLDDVSLRQAAEKMKRLTARRG